jgi:predicted MFS family arabinose efflux permease
MDNQEISGRGLATSLIVGSLGITILGIEPVLLSAMVQEGRIAETAVGALVTTELLTIAIGSIVGMRLLGRFPTRIVGPLAGAAMAALNAFAIGQAGEAPLVAIRAATGVIEGILMAIAMIAIARTAVPERASGLFLAAQTAMQLLAVSLAPNLALNGSNTDVCLAILSGCGLTAALFALAAPPRLIPPENEKGAGRLSVHSYAGLVAVGAFTGATLCVWGYLGLWIARNGFASAAESKIVALSLAAQISGALVAARLGHRLAPRPTILASTILTIMVTLLMLQPHPNIVTLFALSGAFSFLWLFTLPAFTGLLAEIDPTRRALLYIAAVQLAGAASLPLLAGIAVGYAGIGGVFWLTVAVLLFAMALVFGLRRRSQETSTEDSRS